jgi:hypothetical protein
MQFKRIAIALALVTSALAVAVPATASSSGTDAILSTTLNGNKEFPGPGDPNGKGQFAATLSGDTMCYSFYAVKIGTAQAAHIHDAPAGASGPVIITLTPPTKSGVSACITAVPDAQDTSVTMSVSELADLKSEPHTYYVNAHTPDFPAGAIRGQL